MPTFNGLLLRDSLQDTGVVPSPEYPYYSPDLICHAQVADPKSYFSTPDSYGSDPNQPVQTGSAVNFLYVRSKNLSGSARSGYISVYRATASLFLSPSIWKNNRLSTRSGQNYVTLDTLQPGQVGVGNDYFLLSGLRTNLFCLVGVASDSPNPAIPDGFATYGDYILWARQNRNICGRNLTLAHDFPDRQYERLDEFSNPENQDVPTLFMATASDNLPSGTTFGVVCAPLNVNKSQRVDDGRVLTASGMSPGGFNGTVTTYCSLPPGQPWPRGASIQIKVYVGVDQAHPASAYAADWNLLGVQPYEVPGLSADGKLVQLGTCGTAFLSS